MMRVPFRVSLLLIVALIIAPSPLRAAEDPYAIFEKAREFWMHQHYPLRVDYDVAVTVKRGQQTMVERYASAFDAQTGAVYVDAVSDYERAHPASGSGVKFGVMGMRFPASGGGNGNDPDPDQDFIGVPDLAPNYSFGIWTFVPQVDARPTDRELIEQIRAQFHDPNPRRTPPPARDPNAPIATVYAFNRDYTIAYAGNDSVDGCDCLHLTLVPKRDAGRYRLRDLWIDPATFATVRASVAENFSGSTVTGVPWLVDFAAVGGAEYIERETAERAVSYGNRKYDSVIVTFESIRPRAEQLPISVGFEANQTLVEPP